MEVSIFNLFTIWVSLRPQSEDITALRPIPKRARQAKIDSHYKDFTMKKAHRGGLSIRSLFNQKL
jgi:hypothetical protein